ncbi:MAG: aminoacyl-tRNA hydrolase [Cytophagales bacterium]|nr:aminoacyl-tRNA hydrolase [Cytophagales bacterium]
MGNYLIVGLGNPGSRYSNTRHNIGFKILDILVQELDLYFENSTRGDLASLERERDQIIHLLKPNTYMNLSGKSVSFYMRRFKISLSHLLVLTDDLFLPFGRLRIRARGSSGGHRGLESIQAYLQTISYPRLRFGVGQDYSSGQQSNYVLSRFTPEERSDLPFLLERSSAAVLDFIDHGLEASMNRYNSTHL